MNKLLTTIFCQFVEHEVATVRFLPLVKLSVILYVCYSTDFNAAPFFLLYSHIQEEYNLAILRLEGHFFY